MLFLAIIGATPRKFFPSLQPADNELDQFIARRMQPRPLYWQRYVDDIVCLDTDPKNLHAIAEKIELFVIDRLSLSLHPQKTVIQRRGTPLAQGSTASWLALIAILATSATPMHTA